MTLFEAIYKTEYGAEDLRAFIALQHLLEQANIKVVDLDPGLDDVEIQWASGDRDWFRSLEEAAHALADALRYLNIGKEDTSC